MHLLMQNSGIDFNPSISEDGSVTFGDITTCSMTITNEETTYTCEEGSVPVDGSTLKGVTLGGNCMCSTGTGASSVTYKTDSSGGEDDPPLVVTSPLYYAKGAAGVAESVKGWTVPLNAGGTDLIMQIDTGSDDIVVISTLCTSQFCQQFDQYNPEGAKNLSISSEISYGSGEETWSYSLFEDWVVVGESNTNLTSVVIGAVTNLTQATVTGDGILGVGPAYNAGESTIQQVLPEAKTFVETMLADGKVSEPAFTIHFGEVLDEFDITVLKGNNNATTGSVDWGAFALTEGMVVVETVCDNYMTPLVAFELCYQVGDDSCGRKVSIPIPKQANRNSLPSSEECASTPLIDSGTSRLLLPESMYDPLIEDLAKTYGALFGVGATDIMKMLNNEPDNQDDFFIHVMLLDALNTDTSVTFDDFVAASPMIILTFENEATLVASAGDLAQFGVAIADGVRFIIGDTVLFGDSVSFHTTEKKLAFKGGY
ncbi:hypothetical protein SARC_03803 [Sphaeroforma arctica JP610]|uniref:Peptidase A1 domain-containing protein n=1 Tax=Sphaeroforma arctica JP610 TaxID=667725 RepID=A0A0L0G6X5_9EUKA|nr:hypothetical protein SARC_03803 [Sphaeroforma arctica JP610]KNC83983.1 hypothetical protein SARC_03803 [Sphaeroforma arctica JP610]|eukprot:XP_014157885.1 hypothetical protein SARC_03803 [Sphaeroforma arctica JP610]